VKRFVAAVIGIAAVNIVVMLWIFAGEEQSPDAIFINDAVQTALQGESVSEAAYLLADGVAQAFADMDAARHRRDDALRMYLLVLICAFALCGIGMGLYFERAFFMPFRRLRKFAHRIAAGSLDIPLEMDKRNLFGAFTESFDLMRTQLRAARENEYKANVSKKELVASLSHDIKTPIASVMSAMDILLVRAKDEKEREMLEGVNAKLEQINALVTNMFHATLEELQALKVTPTEMPSTEIFTFIQDADYEKRITPFALPHCIVLADALRLRQIFDNLIGNAYKYAKTAITIHSFFTGKYLVVELRDYGRGVPEEEMPLLFNKFYRGGNAGQLEGYGLGLYISKYLIEEMAGEITCENRGDGFTVALALPLAG